MLNPFLMHNNNIAKYNKNIAMQTAQSTVRMLVKSVFLAGI